MPDTCGAVRRVHAWNEASKVVGSHSFPYHPNPSHSTPLQVLVTRNACFAKPFLARKNLSFIGRGLLLAHGDLWSRQRRMINPAFGQPALKVRSGRRELWCTVCDGYPLLVI